MPTAVRVARAHDPQLATRAYSCIQQVSSSARSLIANSHLFVSGFRLRYEQMFALDELELGLRDLEAQMAAWLVKLRAYDRSGEWSADGFASAAAALRHRCHLNVGVARGHVQLARKLEQLPVVAEAFGLGEISRSHASVIAEATRSASTCR